MLIFKYCFHQMIKKIDRKLLAIKYVLDVNMTKTEIGYWIFVSFFSSKFKKQNDAHTI